MRVVACCLLPGTYYSTVPFLFLFCSCFGLLLERYGFEFWHWQEDRSSPLFTSSAGGNEWSTLNRAFEASESKTLKQYHHQRHKTVHMFSGITSGSSRSEVLRAVKQNAHALFDASAALKDDREFMLKAVKQSSRTGVRWTTPRPR